MKTVFYVTGLLALIAFTQPAKSAPASKDRVPAPQTSAKVMALRDSLRASDFSLESPTNAEVFRSNIKELKSIIEAESEPYELRWRGVLALASAQKNGAVEYLKGLVGSKEWFLRDSALKALSVVNKTAAIPVARKLISDASLIVRTSAVISLKKLNDKDSVPLLWEKLEAKENFNKSESLFVRKHIVEALVALDDKSPKERFEALLKDKDSRLHSPAKKKVSQLRLEEAEASTAL